MINRITLLLFIELGSVFGQDQWGYYTADPIIIDVYNYGEFIWVIGDDGGNKVVKINKQSGSQEYYYLNSLHYRTIFVDSIGVWIGGNGNIVLIEHFEYPNHFHQFEINPANVWINDIAYDNLNDVYLFGSSDGIKFFNQFDYNPGDDINFVYEEIEQTDNVNALYADSSGLVYTGENGKIRTYAYSDSTGYYLVNQFDNTNSALTGQDIIDVDFDSDSVMWAINREPLEVFSFDGNTWQFFNENNSPIVDYYRFSCLEIDHNDDILIGTERSGFYKYDGIEWTLYHPENSGLPSLDVRSIDIDENSNKWIGTWDGGLAVFNEEGISLNSKDDYFFKPKTINLANSYPNPFNPITTLRYDLPKNSLVNITIYDLLGRQVKTLVNQTQNAGFKSIIWNATNDYGKPVSAGVYLYQIQAGEFVQTRKMVLLK